MNQRELNRLNRKRSLMTDYKLMQMRQAEQERKEQEDKNAKRNLETRDTSITPA